jgi:hypothetical protein
MELGIVLDKGHYNLPSASEWLEGQPETSFWSGLKMKGHQKFPVRSYRCPRCGYLESYAGG